jgi:pyrimidine operon attenuation protein/uracil phosphoribosyltransferase
VTLHPEGQAFEECRPPALARLVECAARLAVDGQHVRPVDDDAVEPVGGGTVGDVLDRVREVGRRRVRPLVVVADKDHRELADACEVHGLVRSAGRSSPTIDRDALAWI